jgi:DNA-binding PadR family transcriptional regulator
MLRSLFLGFVKIHILHHASKGPVYGLWVIEELERHGYRFSPGTIYPTLHLMTRDGYLRCESKVVNGKVRKYYTITEKGLDVLNQAIGKLRELVEEVL